MLAHNNSNFRQFGVSVWQDTQVAEILFQFLVLILYISQTNWRDQTHLMQEHLWMWFFSWGDLFTVLRSFFLPILAVLSKRLLHKSFNFIWILKSMTLCWDVKYLKTLFIRYIGFNFFAWLTSFIWYSESSKQLCFLVHPFLSHAMISNFRLLFADIFNISVSFWLLHSDQGQFIFSIVEIFIFIECHLVAEFHRWVLALSLSNLHGKSTSPWSVILCVCRSGLLFSYSFKR